MDEPDDDEADLQRLAGHDGWAAVFWKSINSTYIYKFLIQNQTLGFWGFGVLQM